MSFAPKTTRWNAYRVKGVLLAPYIWVMRYYHRNASDIVKAAFEITYYRPAVFRFLDAIVANPDLLHEAPGIDSNSVVFDVGGYEGEWSARVFAKYQPNIYCFEINPDYCRNISAQLGQNPKVRVFDYGLSGENATLPMSIKGMGTTLYAHNDSENVADTDIANVVVRDIVEVMDQLGLKKIDLLKLNIEGGEYDLLERLIASGRIADVACLNIQFHEWLDDAAGRRRRIRKALRRTHHETWGYAWFWEQWVRNS